MKKLFTLLAGALLSFGVATAATIEITGDQFSSAANGTFSLKNGITVTNANSKKAGTVVGLDNIKYIKYSSNVPYVINLPADAKVISFKITGSTRDAAKTTVLKDVNGITTNFEFPTSDDTQKKGSANPLTFTVNFDTPVEGTLTFTHSGCESIFNIWLETAEGPVLETLATPVISADANGLVTITGENVKYTTDGSDPTVDSQAYTAPFTVADNTTVKAMSFGDGETSTNSAVAEKTILIEGVTVEAPVINQYNGTFYISCATPATTLEYSYDETTWNAFTGTITLTESKTVYARATRQGAANVGEAKADIVALPAVESDLTVLVGYGSFSVDAGTGYIKGEAGKADRAYGMKLRLSDESGKYANGNAVYMGEDGGVTRTGIKTSGSRQNILEIPENLVVNRVKLYSYANYADASGWAEINGESFNINDIPVVARGSNSTKASDVRIFNFDNLEGQFTFTHGGGQLVFVLAVDVTHKTLSDPWHSNGVTLEGTPVEHVYTDGEQVLLNHALGKDVIYYTLDGNVPDPANVEAVAPAAAPARAAAVDAEDHTGKTYKLTERPIVYNGQALNISYLAHKEGYKPSAVQTLDIYEGGTTGIESIGADAQDAPVEYFNLQGVRVENPSNGIFIRRQGNTVTKVVVK